MDHQTETKCLDLIENYRLLSTGNKMEFSEKVLACVGIYLAAGVTSDMARVKE